MHYIYIFMETVIFEMTLHISAAHCILWSVRLELLTLKNRVIFYVIWTQNRNKTILSIGWWEIWGTSQRKCSRRTCRSSWDICVSREQTMQRLLLMVCPGKGCQGNMFWQELASCPWSGRRWGYYKIWHLSPYAFFQRIPWSLSSSKRN